MNDKRLRLLRDDICLSPEDEKVRELTLNTIQQTQTSDFTWDSRFKSCSTNRIAPFDRNQATFPRPHKYE